MKRFKNILFFADSKDDVTPALKRAAQLAESNNARLTLVDVVEPVETPREVISQFGIELVELLKKHRKEALEKLAKLIEHDDSLIYTKILIGLPFLEVIKFVQRGGYDLLVKMARPPAGISEKVFGSVDLHLLRKCPCPVLIDRPSSNVSFQQILAAVDTEYSRSKGCDKLIMQLATSLSERENAHLDIVHAWNLPGASMLSSGFAKVPPSELQTMLKHEEDKHKAKLEALIQPYGIGIDDENVHLVEGQAAESINHIAKQNNSDIIVMGTVGRVGIPGLFVGNTAEEIFQTTTCSVLAVKPDGFKSPVEL